MASHRKPRTRVVQSATSPAWSRGAIGVTTAALASVTLLSQAANAAPTDPSDGGGKDTSTKTRLSDVKDKVDTLYRQAGTATQKYNAAKEKTDKQREEVDGMLDQVAKRTDKLNNERRVLGTYAAAQYRTGGISQTATLLLTKDPQGFFKQTHLMERMTGRQKEAVADFQKSQKTANKKRAEATEQLSSLATSQKKLKTSKREIQAKLSEARELLSDLTAKEKARLAEIERQKRAEARQKAKEREEAAEREAERKKREREREGGDSGKEQPGGQQPGNGGSQPGGGSGQPGGSYAAKAEKVLAFAKQQLGKPYVWGATGPNSYDCSGFTQDAWKAGGVSLPRTTFDQVKVGTKVAKSAMKPGDLIFFYDDVSHVGIYVGDGQMIHAPKPGTNIRYESIDYMPFHSAVRPA